MQSKESAELALLQFLKLQESVKNKFITILKFLLTNNYKYGKRQYR